MKPLYGTMLSNPLMLGTAQYPSPAVMARAFEESGAEVATVSLRREFGAGKGGNDFWNLIKGLGVRILPNTAGCNTAREAVTTARMARELFGTDWIKLEVINDNDTLQPDVFGLVEAAETLCDEGFEVFPYTTDDLSVAERLIAAGCEVLMPCGAPIGTGLGLNNEYGLRALRARFPDMPLIVRCWPWVPVARGQGHGTRIRRHFGQYRSSAPPATRPRWPPLSVQAAIAGRTAYESTPMEPRDMAAPSTPILGKAFLG